MPISPANRAVPVLPSDPRLFHRDRRGGFTLMEVVLAMAIIGLLVGLGLPAIRKQAGIADLRIKTFEIATLLRVDRNSALRAGRPLLVTVDRAAHVISSDASSARIYVPASVTMLLSPDGAPGFQFFPNGRASGGTLSLSTGGRTFVIEVNAVTAAIDTSSVMR